MTKKIDLNKKIDCISINQLFENGNNYTKAKDQEFYYSPSGKIISLAEKLPNGDGWIVKTFRTKNVFIN